MNKIVLLYRRSKQTKIRGKQFPPLAHRLSCRELKRERKAMGRLFVIDLEGRIYSCKHCNTHLGLADDIMSKTFRCKHGKAYLFDKVVNVLSGEQEDRQMMTGWHTVVDISCVGCGSIVGWKYEAAHDVNQMYKVGKFIIERFKVRGPDGSLFEDLQEEGSDSDE